MSEFRRGVQFFTAGVIAIAILTLLRTAARPRSPFAQLGYFFGLMLEHFFGLMLEH